MYQSITIVGNLGGDPQMNYMPDGKAVTSFSVATSRRWTDQSTGEPKEETTWFRVSTWGRQAETANQYLSKGSKVLVSGRIKPDPNTGNPRLWTRQDGSVGTSFELTADIVRFMNSKDEVEATDGYQPQTSVKAVEEDDIPF